MKFFTLLAKRVLYAAILLIAVLVLNFLLIHLAPGDPAEVIAGVMGGTTQRGFTGNTGHLWAGQTGGRATGRLSQKSGRR